MISNQGFTLIEIIITIVILTIGIFALLNVFSIAFNTDSTVKNRLVALNLVRERMEEVKNSSSYANIDSFASARTSLTGDYANFDREVTVSGSPKQVSVMVYWPEKGGELSFNMVSLFANYNY